jgi:hypothetical protein
MLDFRNWCEQQEFMSPTPEKPWMAKKKQIAQFWKNLPGSIPIQPTNIIPANYRGSTTMYDGLRVTGSHQFINSVASRLKDMLNYDQGNTKLSLRYSQQVDKNTEQPLPNSFIFYVQVRNKNKAQ